jgi:molybdenum-dependent DNA-binding transcriptional regulator ModE
MRNETISASGNKFEWSYREYLQHIRNMNKKQRYFEHAAIILQRENTSENISTKHKGQ